jgi:NADH:ubiquinone oxidoreductase subunit 5 (subunit L)/multisubunit Na+/H+ antiporter MnhA subunit
MIVSTLVALAGFVTAYYLYLSNPQAREGLVERIRSAFTVLWNAVRNTGAPEAFYTERTDQLATQYAFAHQTLLNKYYIDEFYYAYVVRPIMWLMDKLWGFDGTIVDGIVNGVGKFTRLYSNWSGLVDRLVVDGSVNGVGVLVRSGSQMFRLVQTGIVQNYLLVMALGVFVFTTIYLIF